MKGKGIWGWGKYDFAKVTKTKSLIRGMSEIQIYVPVCVKMLFSMYIKIMKYI